MQVTIIGLPASGKTTVFNALTGVQAEIGFGGGRAAPNLAVVKVPDERLDRLAELYHPRKVVPADVTYADVAIPAGAAGEGTVAPDLLAQVRNADAIVHVLRNFEEPGAELPADPWRDLEELDLEYAVADLAVVQKRLEKLRTSGRHGSQAERDANALEEALLERIEPHLAEGHPLRGMALDDDDQKRLRGYRFLTQKPVLLLVNLDEGRLPDAARIEDEGRTRYGGPQLSIVALAGKLEAEIAQLSLEDAVPFLEDLGIPEASRGRVIRLTYALLGLFSFFTAGEDECRAWTLPTGATAVDAAGAIHSDLARGFIRAEVVTFEDLMACGSTAEARRRGLLRSEGKTYEVKDGDVIEVLFNVAR
jgi:ribosome-binding ATPase